MSQPSPRTKDMLEALQEMDPSMFSSVPDNPYSSTPNSTIPAVEQSVTPVTDAPPSVSEPTSTLCSHTLDLDEPQNSSPNGSMQSKIPLEHELFLSQPSMFTSAVSEQQFERDLPESKGIE